MNVRASSSPSHIQQNQQVWIFQANPNRYRIQDSLRVEPEEYWNLNQHAKKIHASDRVLLWISGAEAGIYALGTVLTEPELRPDSAQGITYWRNSKDGHRVKLRVLVRYDRVFLDHPLAKDYLECDPDLWNLSILRSPRGTNFPVQYNEWEALRSWLGDHI